MCQKPLSGLVLESIFNLLKMENVYELAQKLRGTIVSNKKSLKMAEQILIIAGGLGMKAVYAFTLSHGPFKCLKRTFNPKNTDFQEELEGMVTICFNIAQYFEFWLNSEYQPAVEFTNDDEIESHKLQLSDLLSLEDGLYQNSLLGWEGHDWFWLIEGDSCIYAGGYGGVPEMKVVKFDRKIYFEAFFKALQGSLEHYAYVFQVTPAVPEVGFEKLTIQKSITYE